MFEGKNVLVTGGCGFLGANIAKRLISLGANVRTTQHENGPVIIDDRIEYVKCNLLNMDDCNRVAKDMKYVFHAAAFSSGAAVIKASPLALVTPNVVINAQMMDASYNAGIKKFVYISSSVVYPTSGDRPCKEEEGMVGDPPDIYFGPAWMKRYGEVLSRLYSEKLKNPMTTVVVRPANVFGPYDNFDLGTSHVMAATIRKVIERQSPIQVWGTGDDIRDFIYVDDFVDGLLLAAEKINVYSPINIASGNGYSIKELLGITLRIDKYENAEVRYDPSKPSMIPVRLFDTSKARRILGFETKIDIEEGIRRTIKWYREKTEGN